jgi:hypothetical protein
MPGLEWYALMPGLTFQDCSFLSSHQECFGSDELQKMQPIFSLQAEIQATAEVKTRWESTQQVALSLAAGFEDADADAAAGDLEEEDMEV